MAGFLRKKSSPNVAKSKQHHAQPSPPPAPASSTSAAGPSFTPLYARFASSATPTTSIVSSPMALAPKEQPMSPTNSRPAVGNALHAGSSQPHPKSGATAMSPPDRGSWYRSPGSTGLESAVGKAAQINSRAESNSARPTTGPNKPAVTSPERSSWYRSPGIVGLDHKPQPAAVTSRHHAQTRGDSELQSQQPVAATVASPRTQTHKIVEKPLPSPQNQSYNRNDRQAPSSAGGHSLAQVMSPDNERHIMHKASKPRSSPYDASSPPQSPPVSPRSAQAAHSYNVKSPVTSDDSRSPRTPANHRLPNHHQTSHEMTTPVTPKTPVMAMPTPSQPASQPNRRGSASQPTSPRTDKPLPIPIPNASPTPPPRGYDPQTESAAPSRQTRNAMSPVQTAPIPRSRHDNRRASTSKPQSTEEANGLPSPAQIASVRASEASQPGVRTAVASNRTLISSSYGDPLPAQRNVVPDHPMEGSSNAPAAVNLVTRDDIASTSMGPLSPTGGLITQRGGHKAGPSPVVSAVRQTQAVAQTPSARRSSMHSVLQASPHKQDVYNAKESRALPNPSTSPKASKLRQGSGTDVPAQVTETPEQRPASSSAPVAIGALPEKETSASYKKPATSDPARSLVASPPQAQDTNMRLRSRTSAVTQQSNPPMPSLKLVGSAAGSNPQGSANAGAEKAQAKSERRQEAKVDDKQARTQPIDAYPSPPMESAPAPTTLNSLPEIVDVGLGMMMDFDELEARVAGIGLTPPQTPPRTYKPAVVSRSVTPGSVTPQSVTPSPAPASSTETFSAAKNKKVHDSSINVIDSQPSVSGRSLAQKPVKTSVERSQVISQADSVSSTMSNMTTATTATTVTLASSSSMTSPATSEPAPQFVFKADDSEPNSLLDDDPFARVEGVRVVSQSRETSPTPRSTISRPRSRALVRKSSGSTDSASEQGHPASRTITPSPDTLAPPNTPPKTPVLDAKSPSRDMPKEQYKQARSQRRGAGLEKKAPEFVGSLPVRADRSAQPFPLHEFLADPMLLATLLDYMSFSEWCLLGALSKDIRKVLLQSKDLREIVLERYLGPVGYIEWAGLETSQSDPMPLSLRDLHDYMRGVTLSTYEYSRIAAQYLQARSNRAMEGYEEVMENARAMTAATRAYTRVVLRLRAQAEADVDARSKRSANSPEVPSAWAGHRANGSSGVSSRATSPSPYMQASHSQTSLHSPKPPSSHYANRSHSQVSLHSPRTPSATYEGRGGPGFRSPLYRPRRAPLLRVFVASSEEWLSDAGVVACEEELKKAGALGLLRMGDIVWDVAVGEDGNIGRMVWDGSYLIDLDYRYSTVGDLPKYMHSLAFPPSYFHRVIRTGATSSNPIAHIDVSPWGEEIANNLQLLQDRVRTETPQGNYHNVVRWVHRSTFTIRPPTRTAAPRSLGQKARANFNRLPILGAEGQFIDPSWYGTVVVEAEGTNEALADLQERCGPGAFPPRAKGFSEKYSAAREPERDVWRILRERSRPNEIWIRAVTAKERLL